MFDEFTKASQAIPESPEHAKAHDRIGVCGILGFFALLLMGISFNAIVFWTSDLPKVANGLIGGMVASLFAVGGIELGISVGCLWAPRDFFSTVAGRRWMRIVGARNARSLRVVCILVTTTVLTLLGIAVHVTIKSFLEGLAAR